MYQYPYKINARDARWPCYGAIMHRPSSLALCFALAACAAASDYPSLERRPAERMTGSAQAVTPDTPPSPPPPLSPELTTRLTQLVERARAADQRFAGKRAGAERAVAAGGGGAPGSEGWSAATVALSDLESSRGDGMVALAELDQLYAAEAVAASQTGDETKVTAIAAARDQVSALIGAEDQVLAGLRRRMRD
jgi:hypothetical protein